MAPELNAKQQIYLRVLLDHFHASNPDALLKALPVDVSQKVALLKIHNGDPSAVFLNPIQALEGIHYSWLAEEIRNAPKEMHPFFIASFSEDQQKDLKKILPVETAVPSLAPVVASYFCHQLYQKLGMDQLLPKAFLPESPLSFLANMSKADLVEVIDFFGLYDLSEELRTIVDTKNLRNIYAGLPPKKHQFLRNCIHLKDKLIAPKLNLEKWDGNSQELHKMLHRRGLMRFAKALSGQHPDFIWYITHTLDIGRGKILASQIVPEEVAGVTQMLSSQLLNLIDFLEGSK